MYRSKMAYLRLSISKVYWNNTISPQSDLMHLCYFKQLCVDTIKVLVYMDRPLLMHTDYVHTQLL